MTITLLKWISVLILGAIAASDASPIPPAAGRPGPTLPAGAAR